jgi:hypothetical protein
MRHVPSTGALLLLHEGALLPAEACLCRFLTLLLLWLWQISGAITTAVLSRSDLCTVCSRGVPSPAAVEASGILYFQKLPCPGSPIQAMHTSKKLGDLLCGLLASSWVQVPSISSCVCQMLSIVVQRSVSSCVCAIGRLRGELDGVHDYHS